MRSLYGVTFSLLLLSKGVAAQPGARVEAAIRLRQAVIAERRGELAEARRLLVAAIELGAHADAHRALARVLESQGELRAAGEALNRYAALASNPADREEAAARREHLRRTLGEVLVEVRPNVAGRYARVWVDRDGPRPYPAGGFRVMVEGGEHRVRVEAVGWQSAEQRVTTAFGERLAVRVVMTPTRR